MLALLTLLLVFRAVVQPTPSFSLARIAVSLLGDAPFLAFVALALMTTLVAVLPALTGARGYRVAAEGALAWTFLAAFGLAALKAATEILSNAYLSLGMHHLAVRTVALTLIKYFLAALITVLSVFTCLPVLRLTLLRLGLRDRKCSRLLAGAMPALMLFVTGGYWLNKRYLPSALSSASLLGDAGWALCSALTGWGIGCILLTIPMRWGFSRRWTIQASTIGLLSVVAAAALTERILLSKFDGGRPNVVLISLDTLRADHLRCYGYPRQTSPRIDALAARGVRFSQAVAQSSWTLPSHVSLFTGLYPSDHGVLRPLDRIGEREMTLAEILANAGYETAAITEGGFMREVFGFGQGFDRYDDTGGEHGGGVERISAKAERWLARQHSRSFFLFLHTYEVHSPYDPPQAADVFSDRDYDGIVEVAGHTTRYYRSIREQMQREDYQHVIDKYDGELRHADAVLGRLIEQIEEEYPDTIIVLTSDHGENFLDHTDYEIGHHELYDEIVLVPLIVAGPTVPPNRVVVDQVESIDVLPTILQLLQLRSPGGVEGTSLIPLMEGRSARHDFAFSEVADAMMIRTLEWKLILRSSGRYELYHLATDPEEQRDRIEDEEAVADALRRELNAWRNERRFREWARSTAPGAEQIDELRALGYLD